MSVLIKGMDMPKSCLDCRLFYDESETECWCKANELHAKRDLRTRHPNCPLVEIKTPHGRLIDADELGHALYRKAFEEDSADQKRDSGCWIRYRLFGQERDKAPTVVEAEN